MAKVSILVPIYNVEKYLGQCLTSLVNQTLKDIEIICINDGSTDSSLEILNKFQKKDPRIIIINKKNSGYGASMNMGLNIASGEYIGIVESDDFANSTMFEELYSLAKTNNLDLIKSDFNYYTTSNGQIRKAGLIKGNYTKNIFNIKDNPVIVKIMPSIWSAIYKKDFLIKNEIKFLETPGASYQDTSFAFKTLVCANRIMFTSKSYLNYRVDNENSSVKSKEKVYAICQEWDEITKFLNTRQDLKSVVNDFKLSTQFNRYKWNLLRIDSSYRDDFIDIFNKTFMDFYQNEEIKDKFYVKGNKSELNLLLNDKQAFRKYIDDLALKQIKKEQRRQRFSIRINSSRVSIILFGKQIVRIG